MASEEWIKGNPRGFEAESPEAGYEDEREDTSWDDNGWDDDGWDDQDDDDVDAWRDDDLDAEDRAVGDSAGDDDFSFVSDSDEGDVDAESGDELGDDDDESEQFLLPSFRRMLKDVDRGRTRTTRKVIGRDDRDRVTQVNKFPFSAVCSLEVYRGRRRQIGTGFFVGKNVVMTAGHNLCNNANLGRGYVDKVIVYAERNGRSRYADRQVITSRKRLKVARAWRDSKNKLMDWGIIILPEPYGDRHGAFSLGPWTSQQLKGSLFNVVGYPASKSTKTGVAFQMWADVGKITSVRQRSLRYTMDTAGGQSGAPIIAWKNRKSFVVGVHNYGFSSYNQATRVTQDIAKAVGSVSGAKFF